MVEKFTGIDSGESRQGDFLPQLRALEDEVLADKLAGGCHDALTVLFERHSGLVFRIARRILRNDGEAEETVQQVFLNVYRSIGQFDAQKGTFKTWLLQFAYHRAINRREHLVNKRFYDSEQLDEEFTKNSASAIGSLFQQSPQEVKHLIAQLLGIIKPAQRKAIELTFFDGLTAEEIAKKTGQTPSVIRHNLYRGLKKLRTVLVEQKQEEQKKGSKTKITDKAILIAYRPPTL
jgi:RNA polymerase sigma-70 factor, ECF subfamily